MGRRGDKAVSNPLCIRLDADLRQRLADAADHYEVPVSTLARQLLRAGLGDHPADSAALETLWQVRALLHKSSQSLMPKIAELVDEHVLRPWQQAARSARNDVDEDEHGQEEGD